MKFYHFSIILTAIALLTNCISYDNNSPSSPTITAQNTTNTTRRNPDVNAYILAKGERLATFIQTQNRLNDYAKHDNVPTNTELREVFTLYEEIGNIFIENSGKVTEKEKRTFQEENGIRFDDFLGVIARISHLYKIEYNERIKVWYVELIGRSTTLKIEMSQTRREGMSYSHSVISPVNRWMELNNVEDLDNALRIYINNTNNEKILELFGMPFNFDD